MSKLLQRRRSGRGSGAFLLLRALSLLPSRSELSELLLLQSKPHHGYMGVAQQSEWQIHQVFFIALSRNYFYSLFCISISVSIPLSLSFTLSVFSLHVFSLSPKPMMVLQWEFEKPSSSKKGKRSGRWLQNNAFFRSAVISRNDMHRFILMRNTHVQALISSLSLKNNLLLLWCRN